MLVVIDVVEAQGSASIAEDDLLAEIELLIDDNKDTSTSIFIASSKQLPEGFQFSTNIVFLAPYSKNDRLEIYKFVAKSKVESTVGVISADGSAEGNIDLYQAGQPNLVSRLYCSNASFYEVVNQITKEGYELLDMGSESSAIVKKLSAQIDSLRSFTDHIYVVSNILSKSELDSLSDSDCGTLCKMVFLKRAMAWLTTIKGSTSSDLARSFTTSLSSSIEKVLNFRYELDPRDKEEELSKSYLAMSALMFNLAKYHLSSRVSSLAFILSIRALEFYLISILLSDSNLKIFRGSIGGRTVCSLYLNSKRVSGIGMLWGECLRAFTVPTSYQAIVDSYLNARNNSMLAHGLNLTSEEYGEKSIEYTAKLIEVLDQQTSRSSRGLTTWSSLKDDVGEFLRYDVGSPVTDLYNNYHGIETYNL